MGMVLVRVGQGTLDTDTHSDRAATKNNLSMFFLS
jgi:hypothetical protein